MERPVFPKTLKEFRQQFSSDKTCWEYLIRSRWPEGFSCPKCGSKDYWVIIKPFGYECKSCGRRTSPIAGTVMHRSHLPVQEWFWAAYLVTTFTPGLSAKQLKRQIGCSYEAAWFMLHRLRRAMVNEARSPLRGLVEADETIVGGPIKGKRGRGVISHPNKTLVFGAVEIISYTNKNAKCIEKAGRLRLAKTEHADEKSIGNFIEQSIEKGTTIRTDGWRGYSNTALSDYIHEESPKESRHIHRAFGNLKTWLIGTHHGVNPKYLQSYLDEFVFRYNRRKTPMAAFQSVLGIAGNKLPKTLEQMKRP